MKHCGLLRPIPISEILKYENQAKSNQTKTDKPNLSLRVDEKW